jgi:3-hydroxyacyl-CoA dehydrogenase/enoyl-CoA hydratase/3-hydroxybutyryl-CoA epimerase
MGPVELADTVGLDVCLAVAEILAAHAGLAIPDTLRQKVAHNELGRKSGKGFYRYQKGKPLKTEPKPGFEALADRLILPMVNEAAACLREKIAVDADLIDAGLIFGTGFAPFKGAPLHYAKNQGVPQILERLHTLQSQQGDRFKPDAEWANLDTSTAYL